jgi:hypothetical protein
LDQIVATFPTEYIIDPATLAEIDRVLQPGGRLVVLLSATITGSKFQERGAALLFRVTGQSVAWDDRFLSPFTKIGLTTQVDELTSDSWKLYLLIGEKN